VNFFQVTETGAGFLPEPGEQNAKQHSLAVGLDVPTVQQSVSVLDHLLPDGRKYEI